MTGILRTFMMLTALFLLGNCSSQKSSSQVTINFQSKGVSAQSLSAEEIDLVIVNVSGPGIDQKIVSQKNCQDGDLCDTISLNKIPSGAKRLIQLLIVTKEGSAGQGSDLYYGDVTQELNGNATVGITIKKEDSFSKEASIAGQYVPNTGHAQAGKFLTGAVDVDVQIPGKPTMTIGSTEIFGGWFKFFLLDTVKFRYFFEGWDSNGNAIGRTEIFNDIHNGEGFTIGKIMSLPLGDKIISFKAPDGTIVREERQNGEFDFRPLEQRIFAVLGNINKNVCFDPTAVATFNGNGNSRICIDTDTSTTCDSFLTWSDLTINPTTTPACDQDTNEWELDVKNLRDKERFSGFAGLFTNSGDAGEELVSFDGTDTFSWKVDPKTSLDGVHVFTLVSTNFSRDSIKENDISDGYNCDLLTKNKFSGPVAATVSGSNYSYKLNAAQIAAKSNNTLYMVLCPLAPNKKYYKSAFLYDGNHYSHQVPVEKVNIKKTVAVDGFTGNINSLVCNPVEVSLSDNSLVQAYSESAITVNLSTSDSTNGHFYESYSDCLAGTPTISAVDVNNKAIVYYKTVSSSSSHTWDVTASGLNSGSFNYDVAVGSSSQIKLVPNFYRSAVLDVATSEECVSFYVAAFDSSGELALFDGSSDDFDLTSTENSSSSSRSFYGSQSDCLSASSAITVSILPTGGPLYEVWYRNEDTTPDTINNVLTSCSGALCASTSFNIISPGSYEHFHVDIMNGPSFSPSSCIELKIGAYDNHQPNSYPTDFPDTSQIDLSSSGGAGGDFFPTATCSPSPIAGDIFAPLSGSTTIFYKASSSGSLSLSFEYKGVIKTIDLNISI